RNQRLFGKLYKIDINDLICDDPLSNSMIDLGSDQFQLFENDFDLLVGEKARIRRLSKIAEGVNVIYYCWVKQESEKEQIVRDITKYLNMARLIEVATYQLPINRNEHQSVVSKNRKAKLKNSARNNKLNFYDLSIPRSEIVYAESGKWNCNEDKILEDHNKLVRFCIDRYKEISKKHVKDVLWKNNITLGINIINLRKRVKYYLPIAKAKIPLGSESVEEVEEFVHVLMTIR
ncbi:3763_t:CDS:2, partial [Racocetra persica]